MTSVIQIKAKQIFNSKHQLMPPLLLLIIFVIAIILRFSGLDWDQGTHLHPDERFLTMTATAMRPLNSISEYFDTQRSGWNPHNIGMDFYVYGTLPVHLTRFTAELLKMTDYDQIYLVGRAISAIFDLLTLLAVFLTARRLFGFKTGLAASAFYAVSVLPIQNAHFFTVDAAAVSFMSWAIYFAVRSATEQCNRRLSIISYSICIAAAAASKIYLLAGLGLLPILFFHGSTIKSQTSLSQKAAKIIISSILTMVPTALFFRCFYPYLFVGPGFFDIMPNPKLIANFKALAAIAQPSLHFPPSIQWLNRDFLFSGQNLAIWGMGIPLFCLSMTGAIMLAYSGIKNKRPEMIPALWALGWFVMHSFGPTPTLRYQWPAVPALTIAAGWLWVKMHRSTKPMRIIGPAVLVLTFGWAIAFSAIYQQPHSRVTASKWICTNIASGTVLAFESAWDDAIPLPKVGNSELAVSLISGRRLEMHEPDSPAKIERIVKILDQSDILVITSNRLYTPLCRLPDSFPMSTAFYRAISGARPGENPSKAFSRLADISYRNRTNQLDLHNQACVASFPAGFAPLAVFCSFPQLGPVIINDQAAEEAFTVYDHPQVTLFAKTADFDATRLKKLLTTALESASK